MLTSGKQSNSVVFFGNEKLATGVSVQPLIKNALRAAGFELEQIITGPLSELKPHRSQVAVLAAYGHIVPQRVLDEFPLGIINIHPSLLPAYRGPTPIEQAMLDGVNKTGVSIMRLTAGMDEGPIYKQKTVHLIGNETKQDLVTMLQQCGAELLIDALPSIIDQTLPARSQPHPDRATYSSKLSKEDGLIDWNKSADQLEREVRAYAGWPRSSTTLAEKDVIITKAHVLDQSGAPGDISIIDKQLIVFCKTGSLLIEELQPAGKKPMTSQAFLAGYGSRL